MVGGVGISEGSGIPRGGGMTGGGGIFPGGGGPNMRSTFLGDVVLEPSLPSEEKSIPGIVGRLRGFSNR